MKTDPLSSAVTSFLGAPATKALELTATLCPYNIPTAVPEPVLSGSIVSLRVQVFAPLR
jgi:hypothetical protein